ncbi:hypothetical protein [Novacetimonas hansenii]|uniref:hypothetical protein n=1 Tax=Novacetimonas hansenii TaxID=436 RepID=UPI0014777F80|nr:hypothetical protein [Novacetimonas hansenii]
MTVQFLAAVGLFLTGCAFSQVVAFALAAWRERARERKIDATLGPPPPDPSDAPR